MFCIALIGGIIGCGKTTLIEKFIQKETELFHTILNENLNSSHNSKFFEKSSSKLYKVFKITFDDLCPIAEQAELMKTTKGLRNFRVDLLMAADYFISLSCGSECKVSGPLSERSQRLLQKMEELNNFHTAVPNGIFLVEDNFYYRSMRYDWFQVAKRANIGFCEIFVECPLNTAIQRNFSRGYNIPEQKIRLMMMSMEFPYPEKYKWEKYSMTFDSSFDYQNYSLNEIAELIKIAANNPAEQLITEEKIEAQRVCSKNAVHQADKILRKIISTKITNLKGISLNEEDLKALISFAISIRQEILNDIRQGYIHLSVDLLENLKQLGIESVQDEYEKCLHELFEKAWHEKIDSNLKIKNINLDT